MRVDSTYFHICLLNCRSDAWQQFLPKYLSARFTHVFEFLKRVYGHDSDVILKSFANPATGTLEISGMFE